MSNHKIVVTCQARNIHNYKNIKRKVLNLNADVFSNQQYLKIDLTPNVVVIKIPTASPAVQCTKQQVNQFCYRPGVAQGVPGS
jgi:purine nucleoside permease